MSTIDAVGTNNYATNSNKVEKKDDSASSFKDLFAGVISKAEMGTDVVGDNVKILCSDIQGRPLTEAEKEKYRKIDEYEKKSALDSEFIDKATVLFDRSRKAWDNGLVTGSMQEYQDIYQEQIKLTKWYEAAKKELCCNGNALTNSTESSQIITKLDNNQAINATISVSKVSRLG